MAAPPPNLGDASHSFALGDGARIPSIGFGCFCGKGDEGESAIFAALNAGYKHVDEAMFGGYDEAACGRALERWNVKEKRDKIFITTKLWPGAEKWKQPILGFDDVVPACKESCMKLKL